MLAFEWKRLRNYQDCRLNWAVKKNILEEGSIRPVSYYYQETYTDVSTKSSGFELDLREALLLDLLQ